MFFFILIKFHCTVCRKLILWDCTYSNNIVRSRMENGIGLFIEQVWWIKNSTKQIGAWQIAIQTSDCNNIWLFLRIIHAKAILFLGITTFMDIGVELLLSIYSWRCFCYASHVIVRIFHTNQKYSLSKVFSDCRLWIHQKYAKNSLTV